MGDSESGEEHLKKNPKCMKAIRILNIITALIIIAFGLAGLIFMIIKELISLRFFLVFSPIFMIIFGVVLLAVQCNVRIIIRHFGFLQTMLGRGVFNIYLSSVVFYYFACDGISEVAGYVLAIIMFALGLVYIGFHFCGGKINKQVQSRQQE